MSKKFANQIDEMKQYIIAATTTRSALTESQDINQMSEDEQIRAVNRDARRIQHVNNPSERVQLAAVQQDGNSIRFISNPSERVQLAAVSEDGWTIRYIKNPGEPVQLAAVQQNARAIEAIHNPSEKAQISAVQHIDLLIFHIPNSSERAQIEAVKQNGRAIEYIKNPSPKLFTDPEVKTAVIRRLLISLKSGVFINHILEYLDNHQVMWPELDKIKAAAYRKPITESQDPNQMSEEEQIEYVRHLWDWDNIKNIENPSEAVQLEAVQENAWAIEDIPDPSERVQLAAIQKSSFTINYIKNPTLKVQEALILAYPDHIRSIENPDPALFANNQIKQSIIRLLLVYLTKGIHVFGMISYLRQNHVTWPELDKIEEAAIRKPINEQAKYIPTVADKLGMIKEELMEQVSLAAAKGYNFKKSHVGKILKTMLDHIDRNNQLDTQVFDIIDGMMSNLADTRGGYSYEMQRRMDFFMESAN